MPKYCSILQDDEGFADFSFDVIKVKRKLFGGTVLECAACDEGKTVGFRLEIKDKMTGITNRDIRTFHTYPDGMKLSYCKGLSEEFLESVVRLYGFEPANLQLKGSAWIECGTLNGNPMNLQQEAVEFKCFLNPNDENAYAEFYINVDLPNRKLYWKEKDFDYRENIIRYFKR